MRCVIFVLENDHEIRLSLGTILTPKTIDYNYNEIREQEKAE